MKKLLTLLATMVIAVSLSMPVFAQEAAGEQASSSAQTAPKAKKKMKVKKAKKAKKSKKQKKEKKTEPAATPGQ